MINKTRFGLGIYLLCVFCSAESMFNNRYGGSVQTEDGRGYSYGAPAGILPEEISPEKVGLEHIIPLLDQFESFVKKGNVPLMSDLIFCESTPYLMSFVSDKRFSMEIHAKYAKPLFDDYGEIEPEVIYLYYHTGGDLEELRKLYVNSSKDKVKRAIETCFFDAAEPLQGTAGKIEPPTDTYPLSITVSCTQKQEGNKAEDREPILIPNVYDVYVEFENTSTKPVSFSIPGFNLSYILEPHMFEMQRNGRFLILNQKQSPLQQDITLYPNDKLIKRAVFNFQDRFGSIGVDSVFKLCFSEHFVGLGRSRYSSSRYIASHATQKFFLDIQFQQEFSSKNGRIFSINGIARSNIAQLEYIPPAGIGSYEEFKNKRKQKFWKEINDGVYQRGSKTRNRRSATSKGHKEKDQK